MNLGFCPQHSRYALWSKGFGIDTSREHYTEESGEGDAEVLAGAVPLESALAEAKEPLALLE